MSAHVSTTDWKLIDQTLGHLAAKKSQVDAELGRWLVAAEKARVHRRLGLSSFAEYVERRLGYDGRTTRERLRVAKALEQLPNLRAELEAGRRTWSAVREITRVATPATESVWLEATERQRVKQIAEAVRGRRLGDRPTDPKDPLLSPRPVRLEMAPELYAMWQEAWEKLRLEVGPNAGEPEILRAMIERVLGDSPEREPAYQTALALCAACRRTWLRGGGELVEVPPEVGEAACCDGKVVGFVELDEGVAVREIAEGSERAVPEAEAAHVGRVDLDPTVVERVKGLDPAVGARALVHLATKLFGIPLRSVTPSMRAAVKARHRHRCAVPGCRNHRFVDLHHVQMRSAGGPNTSWNLLPLCRGVHHRAVHEGTLAIERLADGRLEFRHANGTLYGGWTEGAGLH